MLFPGGPNNQDLLNTLQPPSWEYPFGTDNLGRDIFARTIYAARIDLMVGLITTYVPLVLGVLLGLVAGYRGGWLESVVMRAVDVVVAFPFIVLVIAVIAIVGPGLLGVYIGITVVGWALYARLTRAEVLVLKDQQFVLAATSLGYSHTRIMFRHILPNVIRPNLVFSTRRHRAQHPRARLALVPRPRRAAARGRVGADDRRGPDAAADRVVGLDDAGHRRRAGRRRLQPHGRRPRRPPRPRPPRAAPARTRG